MPSRGHARPCALKIGADFNLVVRELLTTAIRARLIDTADFAFDRTALTGMPQERIDTLEAYVRTQAKAILHREASTRAPKPVQDDFSWQLEDWPEE